MKFLCAHTIVDICFYLLLVLLIIVIMFKFFLADCLSFCCHYYLMYVEYGWRQNRKKFGVKLFHLNFLEVVLLFGCSSISENFRLLVLLHFRAISELIFVLIKYETYVNLKQLWIDVWAKIPVLLMYSITERIVDSTKMFVKVNFILSIFLEVLFSYFDLLIQNSFLELMKFANIIIDLKKKGKMSASELK